MINNKIKYKYIEMQPLGNQKKSTCSLFNNCSDGNQSSQKNEETRNSSFFFPKQKNTPNSGNHHPQTSMFHNNNKRNEDNNININKKSTNNIQNKYRDHVNKRMEQSSDQLRKLLTRKDVGEVVTNLTNIKINDVIVISNAEKGKSEDQWHKHGYIFIAKSIEPLKGDKLELDVYEFIEEYIGNIIGKVKYKPDDSLAKFAFKESKNVYLMRTPNDFEKMNYLVNKNRVFKINFSENDIKDAFRKAYEQHKVKGDGYLDYVYNCNHAVYDTIIQAQIIQRLK